RWRFGQCHIGRCQRRQRIHQRTIEGALAQAAANHKHIAHMHVFLCSPCRPVASREAWLCSSPITCAIAFISPGHPEALDMFRTIAPSLASLPRPPDAEIAFGREVSWCPPKSRLEAAGYQCVAPIARTTGLLGPPRGLLAGDPRSAPVADRLLTR